MSSRCLIAAVPWCVVLATAARAAPIIPPPGLNPGDTYQLVFVTSTTRDATSASIGDYDTFVNGVADSAGIGPTSFALVGSPVTWAAIASTATDDAIVHAVVSNTVYNTAGQLVATGFADMWDGPLAAAIGYDETGTLLSTSVWTGSDFDGFTAGAAYSGAELGQASVVSGLSGSSTFLWILNTIESNVELRSLYALSAPITVPAVEPGPAEPLAVPEPASVLVWMIVAGIALATYRRPSR